MKIAVNMGALRGFGSRQVGRGVLDGLAELATAHELLVWVPRAWGIREGQFAPHITLRTVRSGALFKLVSENTDIRLEMARWRPDRLFSLGDTSVPYTGLPHLLLVQQAYLTYRPEELDFPLSAAFRAKLGVMRAYFRLGLRGVSVFTVQTDDMATRLSANWGIPRDRIHVVPTAIDVATGLASSSTPAEPYVCYLAGAAPHKNHVVLAGMMAHLRASYPTLTCRVTLDRGEVPLLDEAIARLGVADAFEYVPRLDHTGAMRLLAGATVAVLPSKLESFGMGYYEAMALNVPVVAADRPFAREACGAAALYADADDGSRFGAAVAALLNDPTRRATQVAAGQARYAEVRCTWQDVTRAYLDLLYRAD